MPQRWIDWQGQTINHKFPLERLLGESEHSAVFLTRIGAQKVALKLSPTASQTAEAQLSRWAAAQKILHPHVVRILDTGTCSSASQQFAYLVMEYAEEDLSTILPTRPLTSDEARDMLSPTLDALAFIHGQGLVHGHIKPANILAVEEQLKLSSDGITAAGQANGVQDPYQPPAQADKTLTPASDLWSLGATLLEALTQKRPPFRAATEKQLAMASLPPSFRNIVEGCLRADPKQRFTIADIRSELNPKPGIRTAPALEPRQPPAPKRRLAPVAAVLGVAALAGATYFFVHSQPQAAPAAPSQATPVAAAQPSSLPPASDTRPSSAPARAVRRVLPEVSKNALRTVHGTIKVRVRTHADAEGNVDRARLEASGPSRFFAGKSLEAAKQWKFDPPRANGKGLPSDWDLEFLFRKASAKAHETFLPPQ